MPASSIPKHRLVNLILTDLRVGSAAAAHFHISTSSSIAERLESFSKPSLVSFIESLGRDGEQALLTLESAFPLRRPPTLYVAFVESSFTSEDIIDATRSLAKKGRDAGLLAGPDEPIPAVFFDERAKVMTVKEKAILQVPIRYERRIEYIVADPLADAYGTPDSITSLETAFVWIPTTSRPKHAVIASCDYTSVRHMLSFLRQALELRLYLTYLDLETLRILTGGANPRSATFTTTIDDPEEVKTLTLSDPVLSSKPVFTSAIQSPSRVSYTG